MCRRIRSNAMLGSFVLKGAKDRVDTRLISRALRFEPGQNISIQTQRYGCLRWGWLETTTHYPTDDVLDSRLGMFRRTTDISIFHRAYAGPVSLWYCRRRSLAHVSSLFERK